jgi:hypothetical protein
MPGSPSMPSPDLPLPGSHDYGQRTATGRWRRLGGVVTVAGKCVLGGSVCYLLDGVAAAVVGLTAAAVAGVAIAVMVSAMLGSRDSRSPFIRLMLIICVTLDRQPEVYLASSSQESHPEA